MKCLLLAMMLAGCSGEGSGDGGGDDTGGPEEDTLEECTDGVDNGDDDVQAYVDCRDQDCRPFARDCAPPVTDDTGAPSNFDCLGQPDDFVPGEGTVQATLGAIDYEGDDPVRLAYDLEVWFNNQCGVGDSDLSVSIAEDAVVSSPQALPNHQYICVLFHAIEGEFRQTIQYDLLTPDTDGGNVEVATVKESTYAVIPAVVGAPIEVGKGIIAGGFDDCDGVPVAGVVASVEPSDSSIAIRYFVDEFPNREPVTTTEDGLWGIINVPPGNVTVRLEGRLGTGDLVLLGEREVGVLADTINIADIGVLRQ